MPTRAELCGSVAALRHLCSDFQALTGHQRSELRGLADDVERWRALEEVDHASESCRDTCASKLAALELEKVRADRRCLEQQVATRRREVERREEEAAHAARREAWLAERRFLAKELAEERARLAKAEAEVGERHKRDLAAMARTAAHEALTRELAAWRSERQRAEDELREAAAELADAQVDCGRGAVLGGGASLAHWFDGDLSDAEGWSAEEGGDVERLRQRVRREASARLAEGERLQAARQRLEVSKQELWQAEAERESLREALEATSRGFDRIRWESAEAEAILRSAQFGVSGADVPDGTADDVDASAACPPPAYWKAPWPPPSSAQTDFGRSSGPL